MAPQVALVTPASLRRHNGDSLRPLAQARGLWESGFRDFTVFTPEPDPSLPYPQQRIAVQGPLRFVFEPIQGYDLIHAHQNAGLFLRGRIWADLHGFAPLESGLAWRQRPLSPRNAAFYVLSRWAARRLARRCERFICAAESIAENVRGHLPGAPPLEVLPNTIDVPAFEVTACRELVVGVIGSFTGRWGAPAFRMALATAARCSQVPFRMVGRMSAEQRQAAAQLSNIEILGEVDEAGFRRFLKEVSVSLIAFEEWCRGGGARQKLLLSAASGLAVVATPAGLEGFRPPPETLIGRSPDELAGLIGSELADPAQRVRRGQALRAHVAREHDTLSAGRRLGELYKEALKK